jgi:ribosomal protein L37AE/L43A
MAAKTKKEKTFKVRKCPKCDSDEVGVVVGREKKGAWECKKCKWTGKDINESEFSEDEFMKYLDDKGEDIA